MELSLWLCSIATLTFFSKFTALTYDHRWKGLTTFPTDIPADTKKIYLSNNDINSFPNDAFIELYQLEILNIGGNPFTQIPDLAPVGDTLKFLRMWHCELTELNASIFNELVVLEEISLVKCRAITSFPDVAGPGNSLTKINLLQCKLSTFPTLSHYKHLSYVSVAKNHIMTSVPEAAVASLHLSGELDLSNTTITSLPDYPQAYENINSLRLDGTDVSFFLVSLNAILNNENNIMS